MRYKQYRQVSTMHSVASDGKKSKSNNDDYVWSGLNYSSIFTYDSSEQFKSYFTYGNSCDAKENRGTKYTYNNDSTPGCAATAKKVDSSRSSTKLSRTSAIVGNDTSESGKENTFELVLILLSFLGILVMMPFSLLVCLKFIKGSERMIVSRLGRFLPPRGPGAISIGISLVLYLLNYSTGITFIFPCIDEWRLLKVSEQTAVLNALQASTCDKAIMEISVRFAFKVVDPILCVNAAQNFDDAIRNMARTIIRKTIDKKYPEDLEKKTKMLEEDFKRQFNLDLQSWGVEILNVEIFDVKLLKKPASMAQDFLKAFLKQPQLTTQFFSSLMPAAGAYHPTPSIFSNDTLTPLTTLAGLDGVKLNVNETDLGSRKKNTDVKILADKLNAACSCQPSLVSKLGRDVVYQVNCSSLGAFYLYASSLEPGSQATSVQCTTCPPPNIRGSGTYRNVEIYIESDDLESVLLGIIDPMDLYTTGRLKVRGDMNLARKLRHLSECVKISNLV